jgi:hypothetical protein
MERVNMESIEATRRQLYSAIDKGNEREILALSRKLDILILKYIKSTYGFSLKNKSSS